MRHQTSVITGKTANVAAQGKRHFGLSKARQTVLASLSGIATQHTRLVTFQSDTYSIGYMFKHLSARTLPPSVASKFSITLSFFG